MEEKKINTNEENFKKKITLYSFVLTLVIVLSHWTHYLYMQGGATLFVEFAASAFSFLCQIYLFVFFMMSGFLLMKDVGGIEDFKHKFIGRLIYLGVPFLVWNVVQLIYNILYGAIFAGHVGLGVTDILLGFSISPFNSPTWYLLALLVLACVSALLVPLKKHKAAFVAVLCLIFVGSYLVYALTSDGGLFFSWVKRLVGYCPLYFLGAFCASYYKDAMMADGKWRNNRMISVFAAVLALCITVIVSASTVDIKVKWFAFQITPVLLWFSVPASALGKMKITFPLTVSPFVYAMHSVLILVLNSLWTQKLFFGVDFPFALDLIFLFVLVGILYLICLGVAFVAKKILPQKIYRIFAGGSAGRKMF